MKTAEGGSDVSMKLSAYNIVVWQSASWWQMWVGAGTCCAVERSNSFVTLL